MDVVEVVLKPKPYNTKRTEKLLTYYMHNKFLVIWGLCTTVICIICLCVTITYATTPSTTKHPIIIKYPCRKEFLLFNNKCYYFSKTVMDWDTSINLCKQRNSTLIIQPPIYENLDLLYLIQDYYWIGLSKHPNASAKWLNGNAVTETLLYNTLSPVRLCGVVQEKDYHADDCYTPHLFICIHSPNYVY